MTTTTATKTAQVTELALADIAPSPEQPRAVFKQESLDDLAADIRVRGILEPLLVRPSGKKFEIVCGERRYRAASKADLKKVPVRVVDMTDQQALEAAIAENLHREDLHPLDEGRAYSDLMELGSLSIKELARRVAKPEVYVARRLSLNNLIPAAVEDFKANLITLGHALELSRLAADAQEQALPHCYDTDWDMVTETAVANKDELLSVGDLIGWINRALKINLSKAPWKLDDQFYQQQGSCMASCMTCAFRTGASPMLFPDADQQPNLCTNAPGYNAKMTAFIAKRQVELTKKGEPPPLISVVGYEQLAGVLNYGQFYKVDKTHKCKFARTAIMVNGSEAGRTMLVCTEDTCKDHRGGSLSTRRSTTTTTTSGGQTKDDNVTKHRARKQELFDMKVNEATRIAIFGDAIKKLSPPRFTPFVREWLNKMTVEWLCRIPSKTMTAINQVWFGGETDDKTWDTVTFDAAKTAKKVEALNYAEVFRLLCLMSFAHYGQNDYGDRPTSQAKVLELAKALDLDYKLRDAEARVFFSSKKQQPVHEAYLFKIKAGKKADVPSIYDVLTDDQQKERLSAKFPPPPAAGRKAAKKR